LGMPLRRVALGAKKEKKEVKNGGREKVANWWEHKLAFRPLNFKDIVQGLITLQRSLENLEFTEKFILKICEILLSQK
jgi:hypothetical protein